MKRLLTTRNGSSLHIFEIFNIFTHSVQCAEVQLRGFTVVVIVIGSERRTE